MNQRREYATPTFAFHGKTANVEFDETIVQGKTLINRVQDLGYSVSVGEQAELAGASR